MDVSKCAQVSEFQEGGYVHIANGDYSSDVIGEIKDLENGKLLVEVDGKEQLLGLEGIWIYLKSCMFVSSLGNIWCLALVHVIKESKSDVFSHSFPTFPLCNPRYFDPSSLIRCDFQPGKAGKA